MSGQMLAGSLQNAYFQPKYTDIPSYYDSREGTCEKSPLNAHGTLIVLDDWRYAFNAAIDCLICASGSPLYHHRISKTRALNESITIDLNKCE